MPTQAFDIRDSATLRAGRLVIVFERRGDRIGHRVVLTGDGGAEVLLYESIEGEPDESWPASPALQEGRVEGINGRDVAMLVGMAGKSHWSVSVEADVEREALSFDIACRIKEQPDKLGSAYIVHTLGAGIVDVSCGVDCRAMPGEKQIQFEPLIEEIVPPSTIRWRYTMRLTALDNR